jgi:murein DD-endopeptidase MepM/ murein hydrolase activator NlpD
LIGARKRGWQALALPSGRTEDKTNDRNIGCMRQKRRIGGIKKRLPKLFRARSVIVVCEQGVDHIPLSPRLQWGGLLLLVGFFCWISYSTGSYMASESVIAEKDRKIIAASLEKKRLGEEMLLMKRDLLKLNQAADDMSDYDKFVMNQYTRDAAAASDNDLQYQVPGSLFASGGMHAQKAAGDDMLQQRLSFLEHQVDKLKEENLNIVMSVYGKTKDRIAGYEEIIAMTGLLPERLIKQAATGIQKEQKDQQAAAQAGEDKDDAAGKVQGQGGPFIEWDGSFDVDKFSPLEWEKGLDHLLIMQKVMDVIPLDPPAKNARISSGFGRRIDPFRARFAMHTGLDYVGPDGTKVLATNDGTVTYAGFFSAYGNAVDIDHGLGITTRYGHLRRFSVRPGQKVKKGDVIGIQGSTGRSTGSHIHYEVRYYDRPLNPMKFIQAGQYAVSQAHQ